MCASSTSAYLNCDLLDGYCGFIPYIQNKVILSVLHDIDLTLTYKNKNNRTLSRVVLNTTLLSCI